MENLFLYGQTQTLILKRMAEFGAYLGFADQEDVILLPKKQVPDNLKLGDPIEVFIYRDSEGRPIATVNRPYVKLGQVGRLKVKSVTAIGAFLDWGLEKDLFLPFKEMEVQPESGDEICVYVYLDKANRLCASEKKVYDHLCAVQKGELLKDENFKGVVYRTSRQFGAFVAVEKDGLFYYGLIPASQIFKSYRVGETVEGRVVRVRPDGKLDLSPRAKAYAQIEEDAALILKKIEEYDGVLPFSDNASPEIIRREFNMSKNGFKKALGHLYKEEKVEITENSVRLL